jgi:hypothetical protein
MRFPWLQVDLDFITAHSRDLSALLGVSRREAIGLAVDLWTWALGRTTGDAPPSGEIIHPQAARLVAGAVDWAGEPEALCGALAASGLLAVLPDGVRIRGMSRYLRTWEKNGRRARPAPELPVTGEQPAECAPVPASKTQTQREETASQEPEPVPEGKAFALEVQKPGKPPRRLSEAEQAYGAMESGKRDRCAEVGEPYVSDGWKPARVNRDLGPKSVRPEERERFQAAWALYLADDGNRVRKPAWSIAFFMSSGVRARYETDAARLEGSNDT